MRKGGGLGAGADDEEGFAVQLGPSRYAERLDDLAVEVAVGAETNLVENRAGEIGAIFFVFFPCGALQSSSSAPPSQRSLVLMRVWCAAIGVPSPQFAGPLSNRLNGQNRPIPRWRAHQPPERGDSVPQLGSESVWMTTRTIQLCQDM